MNYEEYQAAGYPNRRAYLHSLSEDFALPMSVVVMMAELLGPNEDFDGLISELDDLSSSGDYDDEDEPDEYVVIRKWMDE